MSEDQVILLSIFGVLILVGLFSAFCFVVLSILTFIQYLRLFADFFFELAKQPRQ